MAENQQPGRIACPHCGAMIKSLGLAAGAGVNCPKCGAGFRLGSEAEGSGFGVQGSGKEGVQGPKSKVQGRFVAKVVPEPPAGAVQGPRSKVQSQESGGRGQGAGDSKSQTPNLKLHKRDELVDPNMLAPPPPRVKPKPTEVAVVCLVCGTRVYAALEKIGETIKCPDCYSRIEVPALKEGPGARGQGPAGPTLEGTENYGMSEVVERPKYRPLQAARGEYDVLSALDPAAIEQRLTVPGERPRGKKSGGAGSGDPRTTREVQGPRSKVQGQERGDAGDASDVGEISLAPVEERTEAARDPRTILPQPEMEPDNELYDGKYDDGVIGDMVDPRSPDAWKRAPFVYGIVEFLLFASTLLRLAMFAVILTIVAELAKRGIAAVLKENRTQILALFILWGGIPLASVWLFSFAAAFQAIVETTANGENEVATWPDWNVLGWFMPATYILLAVFVASIPGVAVAVATFAASLDDPLMAAFGIAAPIVLSWLVLFPLVLFSMLAEESVFAVISPQTLRSLKLAGDAWVVFYAYSIVVALLGTAAGAMLSAENLLVTALGAAAMVGVLMVYGRLVGRLMWVSGERERSPRSKVQSPR